MPYIWNRTLLELATCTCSHTDSKIKNGSKHLSQSPEYNTSIVLLHSNLLEKVGDITWKDFTHDAVLEMPHISVECLAIRLYYSTFSLFQTQISKVLLLFSFISLNLQPFRTCFWPIVLVFLGLTSRPTPSFLPCTCGRMQQVMESWAGTCK